MLKWVMHGQEWEMLKWVMQGQEWEMLQWVMQEHQMNFELKIQWLVLKLMKIASVALFQMVRVARCRGDSQN